MAGINLGIRLRNLFAGDKLSEGFFENIEDLLIEGDLGAITSLELIKQIKSEIKNRNISTET